jgi:glutamate/tyrosine decarboxylase-like PLP-dependent enzyme
MLPGELRRALDETSGPALVCAQAGEVNTGVVDPLAELAEAMAGRQHAWLHVDGAFGLWAGASPALRPLVEGAALADSWAVDAHKWLNVPYDCGMAIVRDPAALVAALTVTAPYLQGDGARDPFAFVPESSRRARALPVYAALRSLGRQGVAELVERCCALARLAATDLSRIPGVEVLNDVVLNQVLFRVPGDTEAVISHVQRDGTCWLGGTTWRGIPAVRFSVSNWSTTPDDIHRSTTAIAQAISAPPPQPVDNR